MASANALPADLGSAIDPGRGRDYYSISQVAALLGVSRVTVWRWIRGGQLPVARLGHRTTRISRQDLEKLLVQVRPSGPSPWLTRPSRAARRVGLEPWKAAPDWRTMSASEHFAQFYDADSFLLEAVSDFVGGALRDGLAAVVVATKPHRDHLHGQLVAAGLDLASAAARGQYVTLDAADLLSGFMVDGAPEPRRFEELVGGVIQQASAPGRRVRVFGEMVALLAQAGQHAATIRLEELWNDLQRAHAFSLFCGYPMHSMGGESYERLLQGVCAKHSRIIPAESYTMLADSDERLRAVAVLQQKARTLELEIAERRRVEEQLRVALEERDRLLEAERAARQAAEVALKLRDEFLSIASHELKTPLTSLLTHAQLVLRRFQQEGELDPRRVLAALQSISGQADKLARLLGQLLDTSRLEGGKLLLQPERTDLSALVRQAASMAQSLTDRHVITVETPRAPVTAMVDALRLEQVLTNLLDNAVKYSPDGGPIDVVLARPSPSTVELSVRDRGLGIVPSERAQIFDRFYQATGSGHRGGLGLGLYVSRQIVDLHGGDIRAEFPRDGGTRFVVCLPLDRDEHASGERSDPASRLV